MAFFTCQIVVLITYILVYNNLTMNLNDILKKLPDQPGIYLYYDKAGELIYVGKATSLKSRVRSYFIGKKTFRPIEQMLHEVVDIKWKVTDSVLEAVILEAVYIKKYVPKYNVLGKDNKSWNYITVSRDEYPVVGTIREREFQNKRDSNMRITNRATAGRMYEYMFGPYPGLNTKEAMKILRRLFYFSNCQIKKKNKRQLKFRPCFYYQIGQCLGVCTGEITPAEYRKKVIRPLVLFLEGKKQTVVRTLEKSMKQASNAQDFEEAARIRNQLSALERIQDVALINKDFFSFVSSLEDSRFAQDKLSAHSRIEGYDISNLGSTGKVGSMVVFDEDGPIKSQYRKFKIRTVVGQSDVDSLDEMIRRRLRHSEWPMPNVFLIDGGAPQVNRVVKILREFKIEIPVVGIAKGPERKRNDFYLGVKTKEFICWVNANQELLIRVRDEAHRFAITYQRSLRKL